MTSLKNLIWFLLIAFLIISCNAKPKKVVEIDTPKPYSVPFDTITENVVSFLSGMEHGKTGCLGRLDTASKWKQFSVRLDSGFLDLDTSRFAKMKIWADSELVSGVASKTVFYPFGGPDLLNANIFYPVADTYILIGLEPVGAIPDFCSMPIVQVNKYLDDIWYSMKDIFKRSYFITGNMIGALKKSSVNGAVPLITLFIERTGYNIISVKQADIDSVGVCHIEDGNKNFKSLTHGIRIEFAGDTGRKVQTVFYFQTDLSDEGLKKNPGFQKYLSALPESNTYLKAASYLMHGKDFSMIRNVIFDKSKSILQDDSGIAYRYFDKKVWDIHLFGRYARPGKEFSWINETDLAKAFAERHARPVPFTLGYNWRTQQINLLYAVRK